MRPKRGEANEQKTKRKRRGGERERDRLYPEKLIEKNRTRGIGGRGGVPDGARTIGASGIRVEIGFKQTKYVEAPDKRVTIDEDYIQM